MAKKTLADYSIEELEGKKKALKGILWVLTGVIVLYAVFMLYKMLTGTWDTSSPLIVMPMMLFVVLLPINNSQKSIDEEIKKRQEENS